MNLFISLFYLNATKCSYVYRTDFFNIKIFVIMELVANMASFRSVSVELSRYFHVWICIYWQILMLPRSHFILLISFAELSRLSHQTGQFSMTQNRVGHFINLLQCWLLGLTVVFWARGAVSIYQFGGYHFIQACPTWWRISLEFPLLGV